LVRLAAAGSQAAAAAISPAPRARAAPAVAPPRLRFKPSSSRTPPARSRPERGGRRELQLHDPRQLRLCLPVRLDDSRPPVYLNIAAQQQIAEIRREVAEATASGLTDGQLDLRLHGLPGQFKDVIDRGLQAAGVPATGTANEHADAAPA